jgi:hypothetical protein
MFGMGPPFESHLQNLKDPAKSMMIELRSFAMSLGPRVIEEVRPHRVVYAKTMAFRTFLDVEPAVDHLIVETRVGRATPPTRMEVRVQADLEQAKKAIADAYEKVR